MPAPEKKGLSGLAWTGIGCGIFALILIAFAIGGSIFAYNKAKGYISNPEKAIAEMIVASTPELEKISSDDAKGEMTVRTKSGETITVSYADIGSGKFSFKDSTGKLTTPGASTDFTEVPAWVPQVPKISGLPSVLPEKLGGLSKGSYTATSEATAGETEAFFKGFAGAAGFTEFFNSSSDFGVKETMTRKYRNGNREFIVKIDGEDERPTFVHVIYEEK